MSDELGALADDLFKAASGVLKVAKDVADVGGRKIRDTARDAAPRGPHTPHYADSITYDLKATAGGVTAEVGPDKNLPQGPLGNIFEFGTGRQPPQPHLEPALTKEVPAAEKALADGVAKLL